MQNKNCNLTFDKESYKKILKKLLHVIFVKFFKVLKNKYGLSNSELPKRHNILVDHSN